MVNFILYFFLGSGGTLYHLRAIFISPTMASKINTVMSSSVPILQNCQILTPHRNKTVKGRCHIQISYYKHQFGLCLPIPTEYTAKQCQRSVEDEQKMVWIICSSHTYRLGDT